MRLLRAFVLGLLLVAAVSTSGCAGGDDGVFPDQVMDIRDPAWSPDGKWIAFGGGTGVGKRLAIFLVHPDGRDLVRLTPRSLEGARPAWSPDGTRIVFESSAAVGTADRRELYVMNRDGSDLRRLTSNGVDDRHPSWAPDGRRIAFERRGDIYTMSPGGAFVRQLTRWSGTDEFVSWSPDARKIAYAHIGDAAFGFSHVYIVPEAGGRSRRVTPPRKTAIREDVAWSPRDNIVAYWENGHLAVADVRRGSIRRLTNGAMRYSLASVVSWSPDGGRIAFDRSEGGFYGPYTTEIVDVRSGRSTQLHEFLGTQLSWSPDSRWIAFVAGSPNRRLDVIRSDGREGPHTVVDRLTEAR